jgi:hypothetical protein
MSSFKSSFKKFSSSHSAPSKGDPGDKPKDPLIPEKPATQPNKVLAEEIAKYGITRVPVDYYHYGVFRYTNLKDAVAQAKRAVQR